MFMVMIMQHAPFRLLEALLSDIRDGSFDPDASRAGRFTGLAEVELESSPKADTSADVRDNGAGVVSVDGEESAICSFERVSDQPDMDDAPLVRRALA